MNGDQADSTPDFASPTLEPPVLAAEAIHGLAGEWTRVVSPHTEASPAQVLIAFLACAGNCIGPRPHVVVGPDDMHRANLYVLLVGDSTRGAKDRTLSAARMPFRTVDVEWFERRVMTKLNSGAGLIHAVRDPSSRRNEDGFEETVDEGCVDPLRRVFACVSEFAGALRRLDAKAETLSADLRDAWGIGTLGNFSIANASRSSLHHISVLAAITPRELLRILRDHAEEIANGFLNRFAFVHAMEVQDLPRGGAPPVQEVLRFACDLRRVVEHARTVGEVGFSSDGAALWDAVYPFLKRPHPGVLSDLLSKGRAQVVRLSLVFALLDGYSEIRASHLIAALAVWDFCRESAMRVFGLAGLVGDEERIVHAIDASGGVIGRTDLRAALSNGFDNDRLDPALLALSKCGRISIEKDETTRKPTTRYRLLSVSPAVPILPAALRLAAEPAGGGRPPGAAPAAGTE